MNFKTEVFDSEGTLAVQRDNGQDVLHLVRVDRSTATDEHAGPTWRELTDDEHQRLIDAVVLVLKLGLTVGDVAVIAAALDSHEYWQLSDEHYRDNGFVSDPGSDDDETAAEIAEVRELAVRVNAMLHEQAIEDAKRSE